MSTIERTLQTAIQQLAETCIRGDRGAGIDLVRNYWARGQHPTITELVLLASPGGRPTVPVFDALADALADAGEDAAWRRQLERM
jgi:hypothetical protein